MSISDPDVLAAIGHRRRRRPVVIALVVIVALVGLAIVNWGKAGDDTRSYVRGVWDGMTSEQRQGACENYRTMGDEATAAFFAESRWAEGPATDAIMQILKTEC